MSQNDATTHSVLLLNLGGPENQESVKGFLLNLFHDPDILNIPGGRFTRPLLAKFIVSRRLERVKASYGRIGGGSPLARIMRQQAMLLEKRLGDKVKVLCAMRYWHPFTHEALTQIPAHHKVIFLPLYPHKSSATTGSSLNEAQRALKEQGLAYRAVANVESYPQDEHFLAAWCSHINTALEEKPYDPTHTLVIFSAHGLPQSIIRKGDPYECEIRMSVDSLARMLPPGLRHTVAFQSRVGPVKWLEPDVRWVVDHEAAQGIKTLIVIPISFTVDNLETLFELDIELREQAERAGISDFRVVEAPNTHPSFIECLANLVGPHIEDKT